MTLRHLLIGAAGFSLLTPMTELPAAEVKAGKAIYDKSCASCRGPDGKGNPAMIKALGEKGLNIAGKETKQKSDKDLLKVITEGSGKMPPTKGLSEQEQKELLSYVRSLAK